MKKLSLLVLVVALVGCQSTHSPSGSSVSKAPKAIKRLQFQLPKGIQWVSQKQGSHSEIFYLKGKKMTNSPVKVSQHFVKSQQKPQDFAVQIVAPMAKNCKNLKTSGFAVSSQYPRKINYEALCNRFKNNPKGGIISYVSIFSDNTGHHILTAEVYTPATKIPGQFDKPKTKQEARNIQTIFAVVKSLQQMMQQTKVCTNAGKCL